MNETDKSVKPEMIRLVKQTNTAKDDPTYRAFLPNGDEVGLVGIGWTRNGGKGWVVVRKDEASSLTKKNLDDCKRYIAERENKKQPKTLIEVIQSEPDWQWTGILSRNTTD